MTSQRKPSKMDRHSRAFTLIELLVVMAIITMLLAILLPTLSRARAHARKVQSITTIKNIGDALELFRNDNRSDKKARETNGYPPSRQGEDPATAGSQDIMGAHWLVRYLMGKDMLGYAPRQRVPATLRNPGDPAEEVPWYQADANGDLNVDRLGAYLPVEQTKIVPTKDLPKSSGFGHPMGDFEQQVFTDSFGYPILYYVADPMQASRKNAYIASFDYSTPGIYNFKDNGMFTGLCKAGACYQPPWDFGSGSHIIEDFGADPPLPATVTAATGSFQYYILNKSLHDATLNMADLSAPSAVPHRVSSFILISAGYDGLYGTSDDPQNF